MACLKLQERFPTVSVAIPCLNEAAYIGDVLNTFCRSQYPHIIEILVIDGGSGDLSQAKVLECGLRDSRIRLLHNPEKSQSAALNIALQAAGGEVFLRADAHCIYAEDYVERCVESLLDSGAENVGGAQRYIAENETQLLMAILGRSRLGSGGARYRRTDYTGYAETVFLGCFWRKTLLKYFVREDTQSLSESLCGNRQFGCGPFSLENVTNQDAELNLRILQFNRSGIYISRHIRVWYWPRSSMRAIGVQYFRYGRGRAITSLRHRTIWNRGNLPFVIAVSAMVLLSAEVTFWRSGIYCAMVAFGGLVGIFLEIGRAVTRAYAYELSDIWRGAGSAPDPSLGLHLRIVLLCAVTNLAHAAGFGFQTIRVMLRFCGAARLGNSVLRW